MQFQPTEDQKAFRETAKRFATEKLAPTYQERASGHTFDRALIKEMGALGLIGADLPEEFGGLGESSVTSGLIVEEIAYADFNASYVQLLGSLMGGMVAKHACRDIAVGVGAQGGLRRCRHWPGPDRAARRIGCGEPDPEGREVRKRLAAER